MLAGPSQCTLEILTSALLLVDMATLPRRAKQWGTPHRCSIPFDSSIRLMARTSRSWRRDWTLALEAVGLSDGCCRSPAGEGRLGMGLLGGTRACTRSDRDRSGRTMAWEAVFLGLQIVNTARRYKANCLFNAVGASPKASSALIFWVTVRDSSRTCKASSALILRRVVIISLLELQYVLSAIQRDHINSSAARGVFGRSTDRSKSRSAEASAGGGGNRTLLTCLQRRMHPTRRRRSQGRPR